MTRILKFLLLLLPLTAAGQQKDFDTQMRQAGLVDIASIDNTVQVRLMYATADNFLHRNMYGTLTHAYLQPEIAQMVARAQAALRAVHPDYSLIIFDASRPMSVQRSMFSLVAGTAKNIYVANPAKGGGKHNYGTAVDIGIIDNMGQLLDMGTPFDFFGQAAHTQDEASLVSRGLLTQQQVRNRDILRSSLIPQGFKQNPYEWWHFDKYTREEVKQKYRLLDF